jgi:hypothetical protein
MIIDVINTILHWEILDRFPILPSFAMIFLTVLSECVASSSPMFTKLAVFSEIRLLPSCGQLRKWERGKSI